MYGELKVKRGIKWTVGKFDFYLVHEDCNWYAFECTSGCLFGFNFKLEALKKFIEEIEQEGLLAKEVDKAIKTGTTYLSGTSLGEYKVYKLI